MKYLIALACFLVAVHEASGKVVPYADCGSKGALTKQSVDVTPCDSYPCPLPRGKDASFNITFVATQDSEKANSVCHGIISHIPLPFPLDTPDACACPDSGLDCPLKKGEKYTFHYALPVKSIYPAVNVIVKWQLQGDDGKDIICIEFQAKLV